MYMNNIGFEYYEYIMCTIYNMYKTRGMINGNLKIIKPNRSLTSNYYISRGIKLFNRLPINIKLIDNDITFKTIIKKTI